VARSRIVGSTAEDAINLIRSRFEMDDLEVVDTRSDAFDGDFCTGVVRGGRFAGIGGDAIDVSGAEVSVDATVIEDVADKGISVGERSRLEAQRVRMRAVTTAMASKDGSSARLTDSELRQVTHAALMAYVKKSEFGPARLVARNLELEDVRQKAVAQLGSRIEIDGELQESTPLDVDELYQNGPMD